MVIGFRSFSLKWIVFRENRDRGKYNMACLLQKGSVIWKLVKIATINFSSNTKDLPGFRKKWTYFWLELTWGKLICSSNNFNLRMHSFLTYISKVRVASITLKEAQVISHSKASSIFCKRSCMNSTFFWIISSDLGFLHISMMLYM